MTAPPVILALDLATRTGFCVGDGSQLPHVGQFNLPKTGDDVGGYLLTFEGWLTGMVASWEPSVVVFEAPFGRFGDTAQVTRKLHALPGVAEMVCARRRPVLPVRQVPPKAAKKALTGNGNADKAAMVRCAQAYGLTIAVHDEADAFGVWLAALRALSPAVAPRWDFLFARRWAASVSKEGA